MPIPSLAPHLRQPVCSLYLWGVFCFVLDSTYKWDHAVFVFLWFISLSITYSRSIHIVANGQISFFLWLNNIHFRYTPQHLYPFIHQWTLTLFPYLATINNAEMNMGVQVSIFIPLDKYPEMELLSHMLILFLILVSAPIYIPTNSTHSFPFLHILSNTCYC